MNKKQITPLLMFFILMCFNIPSLSSATGTFVNPIKAAPSADPWVIYKDGFHYLLVTSGPAVWIHSPFSLTAVPSSGLPVSFYIQTCEESFFVQFYYNSNT